MTTAAELAPGILVAGFRIEGLIGRGGMGVVYRATQLSLERQVALKLVSPELALEERFRERFLREARLAASIDHPHLLPVHEAGEAGGTLFLAMRLVEGFSLAELLRREGRLAPERVLRLFGQLASALQAAHEVGLLHRDVKPQNVLLAGAGEAEHAYLCDFGLARRLSGGSLTREHAFVGTAAYAAPEQIRGEPLDERCDLYALACLLHECLTGAPPYQAEDELALCWAHLHEPAPLPSSVDPALAGFDPFFTRALAKDPEDRFGSASALAEAAEAALAGTLPQAPPAAGTHVELPRPATPFLGRERELAELLERLLDNETRLVTLTGPGGTGKTRLALRAAEEAAPAFPDGVYWVGLASLRDPALVTETIAQTLAAKDGPAAHIADKRLLLLLDNLEQVIEAAPELSDLLSSCPNLTLLVTSRELLRLQAEAEYEVPPLAEAEAVSLFCARSRLDPSQEIAELCARLDNLPLAVELAAARTKALTPAQILERLSQRLDLLKGGRDTDPRQQTLRATIEWSYELLSEDEQQLLARLSVFAGGCTLKAAEEVCDAEIDTLQSLIEKNLLRFTNERYWMLQTIREYATERLDSTADPQDLHSRHAEWVAELARRGESGFSSSPREWGDRLEHERDNLRIAMAWCLHNEHNDLAHDLAIAYGFLAANRGPLSEGRTWLQTVLQHTHGVADHLRQRALRRAASLAERQRDHRDARELAEKSLGIARELRDPAAIAEALLTLGVIEGSERNFERAESLEREALAHFKASEDDRQVRATLGLLAWVAIARGSYEDAQELCEEALRLSREAGDDRGVVLAVGNLGHALAKQGKLDEALRLQRETLKVAHDQLDLNGVADTLLEIASIAVVRGLNEQAAVMLGASAALREETESTLDLVLEEVQHQALSALRDEMGSDALAAAMGRGREMQLEPSVRYALEFIESAV